MKYITTVTENVGNNDQGALDLLDMTHQLMLMAGFEQTTHPGQNEGELPKWHSGSGATGPDYRLYELKDNYSTLLPVFVRVSISRKYGYSTAQNFPYASFRVGLELDSAGEFVGDFFVCDSGGSAGYSNLAMTTAPGHNGVVTGDGYLVIGVLCGGFKSAGTGYPGEFGHFSIARGGLAISRLRDGNGNVSGSGLMIYGRGVLPSGYASPSTSSNYGNVIPRNTAGRIGPELMKVEVKGSLIPYIPLEGLMPVTGENGFSLQHPMAIGEQGNLYSVPEIGFAMSDDFFTWGSELVADVGGGQYRYVSLNGLGINPLWINPRIGSINLTGEAQLGHLINHFSSESAMWVRIDPSDIEVADP